MNKLFFFLFILIITFQLSAQVKIADNGSTVVNNFSILELESSSKALVLTRLTTNQMNAITPLQGALIYNTDKNCIYLFKNNTWTDLCQKQLTTSVNQPTNSNEGDFWINPNDNSVSIFNGNNWVSLDSNPRNGSGIPNNTNVPNPNQGDIYVNNNTGDIYAYDGTNWINSNGNVNGAINGLTLNNQSENVELGGALIKPTVITTDNINTLAITGLLISNDKDYVLTVDNTNSVVKKNRISNLLKEKITNLVATNNGQITFTNLDLNGSTNKIKVYRNGVNIDFSVVNNTTITIESDASCYIGDKIKIVQLY